MAKGSAKNMPPATSPEARENQLIAMATDEAERRIRDGTASSQIIAYFLKQGSPSAKYERERQRLENELLKAKTDAIRAAENSEKMLAEAIKAMKSYKGELEPEEEDDDDYY